MMIMTCIVRIKTILVHDRCIYFEIDVKILGELLMNLYQQYW